MTAKHLNALRYGLKLYAKSYLTEEKVFAL